MEVVAAPQTDAVPGSVASLQRQPPTKHRLTSVQLTPPPRVTRGAGVGLILSLIAFLFAASGWLWLVQEVPARTAFVYFADSYPTPFASPSWIDEDGDRFGLLDGLTLQVENAGFGDGLTSSPWDQLETAIRTLHPQIKRGEVLIVDVRGVGAVTPDGQPALIPPFANPFDSGTWILLADFCKQIEEMAPESQHTQLVLDCLPTRTDWDSGWLYNGFPEAVDAWLAQPDVMKRYARFTVYCRSGDGETRWRSWGRRGSVLQDALWHGLAGEADDLQASDGNITNTELISFLKKTLPDSDPVEVFELGKSTSCLVHALPTAQRDDLLSTAPSAEPENADSELLDAWRQCDHLLHTDVWRKDLPAAGRLLRALASWESHLWSGRAGAAESMTTGREVTRWLSYLQRQAEANPLPVGAYPLLKLQQQTGIETDQIHSAQTLQDEMLLAADRDSLTQQSRTTGENELLAQTSLAAMASLLAEAAPPDSWQHPDLIQKVLSQRARFENIAVPEDIRVSRQLIAALDVPRKHHLEAFDALQVGATSHLEDINHTLAQGESSLQHCLSESTTLHQQLALCDRIRLELPFLAEWVTVHDANTSDQKDQLVNQVLLPLLNGINDLDARLHPPTPQLDSTPVTPLAVERGWNELRSRFDEEWTRLLQLRHLQADDLDALERLLQVPLLSRTDDEESRPPAEQRIVLLQKLVAARTQQPQSSVNRKPSQSVARMLSSWDAHPALVLTGPPQHATGFSQGESRWECLNAQFCRRLSEAEKSDSAPTSAKSLSDGTGNQLLSSRRVISLTRTSNNDWAREYRRLAWSDLLLWLAEGSLREFWGTLPETNQILMSQQVNRLLTVVAGITDERQQEITSLRQQLSDSIAAAESGLSLDAASLTPVSPSDELSTHISVRANGNVNGLPDGMARVGIQHLEDVFPGRAAPIELNDLLEMSTLENDLPLNAQLVAKSFEDVSQPLFAELWFRGNKYRSNFRIIPAGGRVSEFEVDPAAETTFTVSSRQMKGAAMTFILDCSASMQEEVPREGEQGKTTKLTAAIASLKSLLEEMTDQTDASVGVMLYGHRATHDPKSQKVIVQKRYADTFAVPDGLQPYHDVETILPPGRFGPPELGQVSARLDDLLPWGETPLYMAVSQAAAGFDALPTDVQRHIVVITDGRNYQFNPPPDQRVEFAGALAKAHDSGAIVHVIGFGMSAKDQQAAGDELGTLASQTGGTSQLDVSRASQLIQKLRSLVGPASFTWTGPDGKTHESPVNAPVTWTDRLPASVSLTYENSNAAIQLNGGEAVDLLGDDVRDSTGLLPSAEYTSTRSQFVALNATNSEKVPWLVGVHQHQRSGTDAVFTFSIKQANRLYLTRPELYQITVQPLDQSGAELGVPFIYQGDEFVSRTPVPVMQIKTDQWPVDAPQANVRLSAIDAVATADETLSLPSTSKGDSTLAPGVQWELRQTANFVQCILRHQPTSPGLGELAVTWMSGPALKKVRRRLDPDAQIEVHTFIYAQAEDENAPVKIQLSMPDTASQRVMPAPLRVPVLNDEGLIAPGGQARQTVRLPELVLPDRTVPAPPR